MFTIQELYNYSHRVRDRFAKKLAELTWEEAEKNREASYHSMKDILLHMTDNEDWMVNYVIQNNAQNYTRRKSAEYPNMKIVLEHLADVQKKTEAYLRNADEAEFTRRVRLTPASGPVFDLSVEECLFQSFTEQLYHMGELIALLWQDNIEPPKMQWFWNNPRVTTQTDPSSA